MKNQNPLIIGAVALLVGAGTGFIGGIKYQESQTPTFLRGQFDRQMGFGGGNGTRANSMNRGGFRPVNGEIIAVDSTSITVKLADGSSKIILLSGKTNINKATDASTSDLTTGSRVAVFGTEDSTGTVTATSIQLNPVFRMGLPETNATPSQSNQ